MHRTVQAHILYIFKINRATLARTQHGGQFCLICQYRQTHCQPFIKMASQPLLKLTSSHSPLNTHTHTHVNSLKYIHIVNHTRLPPPQRTCTKPEGLKKETKHQFDEIIIKHMNAIFLESLLCNGGAALDGDHRTRVWKELVWMTPLHM